MSGCAVCVHDLYQESLDDYIAVHEFVSWSFEAEDGLVYTWAKYDPSSFVKEITKTENPGISKVHVGKDGQVRIKPSDKTPKDWTLKEHCKELKAAAEEWARGFIGGTVEKTAEGELHHVPTSDLLALNAKFSDSKDFADFKAKWIDPILKKEHP